MSYGQLSEEIQEKIREYIKEGYSVEQISKKLGILDMFINGFLRKERNEVNKKAPRATYARYTILIKKAVLEQLKMLLGTNYDAIAIKRTVELYFKGMGLPEHTLVRDKEVVNVRIKSNSFLVKQLNMFIEDVPCSFTMPDAVKHIISIQYTRSLIKEV